MPRKKSLSIKLQRSLLSECVIRGKENPQLQVILDVNNNTYYLHRVRELVTEAVGMVTGQAMDEKLKLAQILLNIVRAECRPNLSNTTAKKDQKQKSKGE